MRVYCTCIICIYTLYVCMHTHAYDHHTLMRSLFLHSARGKIKKAKKQKQRLVSFHVYTCSDADSSKRDKKVHAHFEHVKDGFTNRTTTHDWPWATHSDNNSAEQCCFHGLIIQDTWSLSLVWTSSLRSIQHWTTEFWWMTFTCRNGGPHRKQLSESCISKHNCYASAG